MIKVALAPGQSNYYDDLSGVLLSLAKKEAVISEGINTVGLINGVKAGKIVVVSGTLSPETSEYSASEVMPTYYRLLKNKASYIAKTRKKEIVEPAKIVEKETIMIPVEEEAVETVTEAVDEVVEPVVEEVIAEPAKPVRKRKKKADTEVAVKEEE